MSYQVIISKPVQKQLNKFPADTRKLISERILLLAEDPPPSGVKKLKGLDNEYRIRIGDYRVRYEVDDKALIVVVLHCKNRKDAYRN
jgi:mRNA interferase RelE/StbE